MRLVIDMNLSVAWVEALRSGGTDAVHWSVVGPQDAPDEAIMDWARANGAIVLTRDLDFGIALMRQARKAPSVIQIRCGRIELERHVSLVNRVLKDHREPLDAGAIVTVENERVRVRALDSHVPI
ncbi:DUF5615 family PIN-like protein [Methylobacterium sp. J-076]|uniref:DUF5615 family PIN-like protein n=1 Tax=Methylobacterium sp. J-076 TaxID=2836655 RepID=UPI001FBAA778|nr:DUF5615 family PIN-like protein [Methylobacterium sp. J-076]MCJ2013024.1 DUF5615 family PIN-like protein [Methylobacterium sp. J-076]